jgi:AraC family transcriptional regulator
MVTPLNEVFTVRETHGRVLRPENRLIAHSQDIGWRSLYAAIIEEAPLDTTESPIPHPSLIYHLSRPTEVMRKIDGGPRNRALIVPRRICITPADTTTQWQHSGHPEILQIYLRQSLYASAVNEMYGCDVSEAPILPRFAVLDPLLEQLAITITTALREDIAEDGLYVDTLAQMIAVHLARNHSSKSRSRGMSSTNTISGTKMRRLIEFVEDHLECDLTLEAMAAEVSISPLYLPRAFKTAVGQSPHQYVLERRIERAKKLLLSTDSSIADVALAVGFSSQSHLSNWFLRVVGVSPAAYRRQSH